MNADLVPPNVPAEDRERYFNPMLTVHWNGDRDEVEDFEHTYRQLLGAGDCDGIEDLNDRPWTCRRTRRRATAWARSCSAAASPRRTRSTSNPDLGAPNRNLRGKVDPSKIVGIRLSHMADFVYSLTEFPTNPNLPDAAAERGRQLFNDPQTKCAECHNGGPPGQPVLHRQAPGARRGLHAAGRPGREQPVHPSQRRTDNVFDRMDPNAVATATQSFQNQRAPIPASRGTLGDYVTPVLNDLWNTAPYLHDGSAPTLLDVIRPCDSSLDECEMAGRGRNLDDQHGATSFLTPQQLNDLAAFQNTLTTATVVGSADRVVSAGTLKLTRAILAFGPSSTVGITGVLGGVPGSADPSAGVILTLGVPSGGRMTYRSWAIPMQAKGRAFVGELADGGGSFVVRLRRVGGDQLRVTVAGRQIDLTALDTQNRDLTVALEIGGTTFVRSRNLHGAKKVFRLPRRGGRR